MIYPSLNIGMKGSTILDPLFFQKYQNEYFCFLSCNVVSFHKVRLDRIFKPEAFEVKKFSPDCKHQDY